jgi:hypothetical protein
MVEILKWLVEIEGDTNKLAELSRFLNNSRIQIIKEEDSYFIFCQKWIDITDCEKVRKMAEKALEEINGIAKLLLGWHQPVKSDFNVIAKIDEEGFKYESVRSCLEIRRNPTIPLIFKDSNDMMRLYPDIFIPKFLNLAKDDCVRHVIRLASFGFDEWYVLYCILETIEYDMGGHIKWIDKKQKRRFDGTVQDLRLIGLQARHGYKQKILKSGPMLNPMTLYEARNFIWGTIIKWLNEKELKEELNHD